MELGCSYMNNLNYLFITWFPPKPDFLPPPLQPSSPQLVLVQGMWKEVADVSWKMGNLSMVAAYACKKPARSGTADTGISIAVRCLLLTATVWCLPKAFMQSYEQY